MAELAEVGRQVSYWPPELYRGKYHAAKPVSHVPVCGAPVLLDTSAPIVTRVGQTHVHPIVCRRCLRLTQKQQEV